MMPKRTIFFDGACHLCSREIEIFRKRVTDGSLAFVDISDSTFDAIAHGIDPVRVNKEMHVRDDEAGRMHIGLDALIAMWECVPGFRWLAKLNRFPLFRPIGKLGYALFAWVRPKLPRRKRPCDAGTCPI